MRVSVWVEKEVEINVAPAEVLAQLPDTTPGAASDILAMLSRCHSCIAAITEAQIAAMNTKQREMIRAALYAQAMRYQEKPATPGESEV